VSHVAELSERIKLKLPADLSAEVNRMAGGRYEKSAWIEEAIRQRVQREGSEVALVASDLPPAARERVERYVSLLRAALQDEELSKLEEAWSREEDPNYYGLQPFVPSTLDASIDALIGRGNSRRVPAARGCM